MAEWRLSRNGYRPHYSGIQKLCSFVGGDLDAPIIGLARPARIPCPKLRRTCHREAVDQPTGLLLGTSLENRSSFSVFISAHPVPGTACRASESRGWAGRCEPARCKFKDDRLGKTGIDSIDLGKHRLHRARGWKCLYTTGNAPRLWWRGCASVAQQSTDAGASQCPFVAVLT